MRTKTLLLAAVLSAAGIASSLAQAVYSVNAVGYVNMPIVSGFQIINNPLNNTAPSGNTVTNLFASAPDGTIIYRFLQSRGGFVIITKQFGSWSDPADAADSILPGEGFFVYNGGATTWTNTFVGEVMQGSLSHQVLSGLSIQSSEVPQAGGIVTPLGYPVAESDVVYIWDVPTQAYKIAQFVFGSWSGDFTAEPTVAVGQGFFVSKPATVPWVRNFSVNTP